MRNRNMHHRKTHLAVPQWTKGICHLWSRGRHFSPSLPGDRYLKLCSKSDLRAEISGSRRKGFVTYGLGADISLPPSLPGDRYLELRSKSDLRARNLGEHLSVRRSGATSRGTALHFIYANPVLWAFFAQAQMIRFFPVIVRGVPLGFSMGWRK